jgi:hypothetical protein
VLAGNLPVPQPIALQVECILREVEPIAVTPAPESIAP